MKLVVATLQQASRQSRRSLLPLAGLLALAAVSLVVCVGESSRGAAPRKKAPNLLVIMADDLSGFYVGATGDPWKATPNIDALARQGVLLERAFCNAPVCTPSRQSLITGLLPHATGVTRLETRLPETTLTLGRWMSILGYRTAAIGKMHFNSPSHHGFDLRIDVKEWLEEIRRHPPEGGDRRHVWRPFVDPPVVWLNARCEDHGLPAASMESTYFVDRAIEVLNQESQRPFAMVVGFYEPHAPFRFPREWRGRYRPEQFSVPPRSQRDRDEQPTVFRDLTDDDIRGIQAAYYTSLSYMDAQIGRLMRALDESGKSRDTLVVFLSDNGYMLGQHGRLEKHCFFEPSVRVPLILRWPGHLPEGRRMLDLIELVDLVPTLCHLLEVPKPTVLHGIDLAPMLEGKPGPRRDPVLSEYTENEEAMVRSERYKLIVGTGRRHRKDHLSTPKPPSGPYQQLYDLQRDPDETTDLSQDPHLESVRNELLQKMYQRLVSTWTGPEPIPGNLSELETIHWCLAPRDVTR
jgi:choline-sulfatase